MQSIKRALLYGLLLWLVWTTIVVVGYQMLPQALASSAFFVTMKTVLLAMFAILLTVHYMKKVGSTGIFTAREGVAVGMTWALIMILLDMSHYIFMEDGLNLGAYLLMSATAYLILPFTTGSLMGWLRYAKK